MRSIVRSMATDTLGEINRRRIDGRDNERKIDFTTLSDREIGLIILLRSDTLRYLHCFPREIPDGRFDHAAMRAREKKRERERERERERGKRKLHARICNS